jgi:hypothetical protein
VDAVVTADQAAALRERAACPAQLKGPISREHIAKLSDEQRRRIRTPSIASSFSSCCRAPLETRHQAPQVVTERRRRAGVPRRRLASAHDRSARCSPMKPLAHETTTAERTGPRPNERSEGIGAPDMGSAASWGASRGRACVRADRRRSGRGRSETGPSDGMSVRR